MGIEKQVLSCRLDEEVIAKLKRFSEIENRSLSNLIETILKNYIREQEKTKKIDKI